MYLDCQGHNRQSKNEGAVTWNIILWLMLSTCVCGTFVAFFLFFPHQLVEIQGKFYRRLYKTYRKMTDDEIDAKYQLPTDRFFMGPRSQFIANAPNEPRKYTRLLNAYRVIGVFALILWFINVVGIVCFVSNANPK